MFRASTGSVWGVLLIGIACKGGTGSAPAPSASQTATAATAGGVASSNVAAASERPAQERPWVDETEVRRSFDSWLAAQNQQKFADYAPLYASRFTGTKRVGDRVTRFNRETWLADREPMFKPGLAVEATDVEIGVAGSNLAQVTFVQRFSTRTFSDQGKKRLMFTREPEGLRITTEEMLDSSVALALPSNTEPMWLVRDGILRTRETLPKQALPVSPKDYREKDGVYTLEVALTESQLPAAARAWLQRRLSLLNPASGTSCSLELGAPHARVDLVPHFGMVGAWKGEGTAAPASRQEIAKQLWELASDEVPLTFEVQNACSKTGLAVPAGPTEPRLIPASEPNAALVEWARQRYLETAELKALRAEAPEGWPTQRDIQVRHFESPSQRWVVVAAGFRAECALVRGLTVVYELADGEALKVKSRFVMKGEPIAPLGLLWSMNAPAAVVTSPRDVNQRQEVWTLDGKNTTRPLFALQYFDCPC